jgi:hypothetical protein
MSLEHGELSDFGWRKLPSESEIRFEYIELTTAYSRKEVYLELES